LSLIVFSFISNPEQNIKPSQSHMMNIFDILPDEIQEAIYIMRIDQAIKTHTEKKNKFNANMIKMMDDVMGMISKIPGKTLTHNNIPKTQKGQFYYDPSNVDVYVMMSMAHYLLNHSNIEFTGHQRLVWVVFLLRPVEIGLIEYQAGAALRDVLHKHSAGSPHALQARAFYNKTSALCTDMINTIGCRRLRPVGLGLGPGWPMTLLQTPEVA
jgi:hypothetical protein